MDSVELIVSNPPYLKAEEWEKAEKEVKVHDPKIALVAGDNGFSELSKVIDISAQMLSSGGLIALEFGISHADQIIESLSCDFENIEILKDLSHYRRFAIAKKT
jgi:release factor glutamine methyltransferase